MNLLLLLLGCPLPRCGPGTVEIDGRCVLDEDDDSGWEDYDSDEPAQSWEVCPDGSAPYTTVQDAIDDATEGAVIDLCPGTYAWVAVDRVGVTLRGFGKATLEGGSHPAILVEDQALTLSGVRLTGQSVTEQFYLGLKCVGGALTLRDVELSGMHGDSSYYGLFMDRCEADIDGLLVEDNMNIAALAAHGGGSLILRHGEFYDNKAGRLVSVDVPGEISNSVFAWNEAKDDVLVLHGAPVRAWNLVLWDNDTNYALRLQGADEVQNSVIARSSAHPTNQVLPGFAWNDLWSNGGQPVEGENLMDLDPKFVDPDAGDFNLQAGLSPCVDAGNPLSAYEDTDGSRADLGLFGGPHGDWTPRGPSRP